MIRVSILYPNRDGSHFDLPYYIDKHMPLAIALLSSHSGYRGVSVEHGLGGVAPGAPAAYVALCHFLFDSVDAFLAAFGPNAATLQGDMPMYTDVEPIIQFSEVLISA